MIFKTPNERPPIVSVKSRGCRGVSLGHHERSAPALGEVLVINVYTPGKGPEEIRSSNGGERKIRESRLQLVITAEEPGLLLLLHTYSHTRALAHTLIQDPVFTPVAACVACRCRKDFP